MNLDFLDMGMAGVLEAALIAADERRPVSLDEVK